MTSRITPGIMRSLSTPTVEIVFLDDEAKVPTKKYEGDAGYDLYVSQSVVLQPHTFMDVHTGIAIKLPNGYFARITGRSSTVRTKNLQVQEGIIDTDYTGELFIGVWNLNGEIVTIHQGERIAQLIPQRIEKVYWMQVDCLPNTERGSNGFGSTGS